MDYDATVILGHLIAITVTTTKHSLHLLFCHATIFQDQANNLIINIKLNTTPSSVFHSLAGNCKLRRSTKIHGSTTHTVGILNVNFGCFVVYEPSTNES